MAALMGTDIELLDAWCAGDNVAGGVTTIVLRRPGFTDATLRIDGGTDWSGTVGVGVCAGNAEYFDEPALALMLGMSRKSAVPSNCSDAKPPVVVIVPLPDR